MKELMPVAEAIAAKLIAKNQTIAVAESSTGGLIAAALLAVPGASKYFLGGAVVYTHVARKVLMDIQNISGMRSSSEPYALVLANSARQRLSSTWGLSETGAAGPSGNGYGDAAGHTCIAIAGPVERVMTLETGNADRFANMHVFAKTALEFLLEDLSR